MNLPYSRPYGTLDTAYFLFAPSSRLTVRRPGVINGVPEQPLLTGYKIRPNAIAMLAPSGKLFTFYRHGHWTLSLFNSPILICHQDWCGNRNRRIRPNQDANHQREAESVEHLATK